MSRILVSGICPLPFEDCPSNPGPGIRTWQFAKPLAHAGHDVHVLAMQIESCYASPPATEELVDGVKIHRATPEELSDLAYFDAFQTDLAPDAMVGATVYGSNLLARLESMLPFWADQFGHVMAEAQAKARLERDNWPLEHFWGLLEPALRKADRFSVVSERQRWALIGELGVVGRLRAETCGYEFTSVIPCAVDPQRPARLRDVLRGSTVPEDSFVVLWSGGYNVWSDVDTLFSALEFAMARNPRIEFVSTGGGIQGHDDSTYEHFEELVRDSPFSGRYHLLGWLPQSQVADYVASADVGVLCELPIYEGALGSKNRLVQWMGNGLPILYNRFGEIGDLLHERQLGMTFPVSDSGTMGELILWASSHPAELSELAERARQYARTVLTFEVTTRDLVAWAERPRRAPDRVIGSRPSD